MKNNNSLITTLANCVSQCNECHDACLHEKMVDMMVDCIRLDKDCSVVCAAALQLVHTGNHLIKEVLALCAHSCEMCATECAKHKYEHCQECARVCRECAAACRAAMD